LVRLAISLPFSFFQKLSHYIAYDNTVTMVINSLGQGHIVGILPHFLTYLLFRQNIWRRHKCSTKHPSCIILNYAVVRQRLEQWWRSFLQGTNCRPPRRRWRIWFIWIWGKCGLDICPYIYIQNKYAEQP